MSLLAAAGLGCGTLGCGESTPPFDPVAWDAHKRIGDRVYFGFSTDPDTVVDRARVRRTDRGTIVTLGLLREKREAVNSASVGGCVVIALSTADGPSPIRDGAPGDERPHPDHLQSARALVRNPSGDTCRSIPWSAAP